MSTPLATIFHGDVTLEQGSDISQFGWGDMNINRRIVITGTEDSTGAMSTGTLLLSGGARIQQSLHVHKDAFVLYGVTRLTETHIDTTTNLNGNGFSVTGGNAVTISVGAGSHFISTAGNLQLESETQRLLLHGGLNSSAAINIAATHIDGGVQALSGERGEIRIGSGSGGIHATTSHGNVTITANDGSGSFVANTLSDNQDLLLSLRGSTSSQLLIESAGTNVDKTALLVNTTNTAGNIQISNANGIGSGNMSLLVGSGGLHVLTNTSGAIQLTSQAAPSSFFVQSAGPNQHLSIELQGHTDSTLRIKSDGSNVTNTALEIATTHSAGNIAVTQALGNGSTSIFTGSGGFETTTQTGGKIQMTAYGSSSLYTNATTADEQNLTVSVTGNTNSRVIISSTGTGNDAVNIETTNGSGGVFVNSAGGIRLETSDISSGIQIASQHPGTPVKIGTPTSVTTIFGDLFVRGNTSSVDQQVVTIDDNIITLNNAPYGTSDGGVAIKRFQTANNAGTGDVVQDTPEQTGNVQNGGNDFTHVHLDSNASNLDDFYSGWWVKISNSTGEFRQVRKIKSYNGTTKIASIYTTEDQLGVLGDPQPVEGMDFQTPPDSSFVYSLYPCHYVMSIWDESHDEFALVCSSKSPSEQANIAHYADLHVNDMVSNGLFANTVNGSAADITFTVNLNDGNTIPVQFPSTSSTVYGCLPTNYGVHLVFVRPMDVSTRAHAIFMIGRVDSSSTPGTVVRLISVKGVMSEQLDMQWRAGEYPELFYRPKPQGGSGTTTYKVKVVTL